MNAENVEKSETKSEIEVRQILLGSVAGAVSTAGEEAAQGNHQRCYHCILGGRTPTIEDAEREVSLDNSRWCGRRPVGRRPGPLKEHAEWCRKWVEGGMRKNPDTGGNLRGGKVHTRCESLYDLYSRETESGWAKHVEEVHKSNVGDAHGVMCREAGDGTLRRICEEISLKHVGSRLFIRDGERMICTSCGGFAEESTSFGPHRECNKCSNGWNCCQGGAVKDSRTFSCKQCAAVVEHTVLNNRCRPPMSLQLISDRCEWNIGGISCPADSHERIWAESD